MSKTDTALTRLEAVGYGLEEENEEPQIVLSSYSLQPQASSLMLGGLHHRYERMAARASVWAMKLFFLRRRSPIGFC